MPARLTRYDQEVGSVFDLLGRGEVDLTAALGWVLTRSPALRSALWERLGVPGDADQIEADLEVIDDAGRTDLELSNKTAKIIIEAKKGWLLPGEVQLSKYAHRFDSARHALLVSLSDSSPKWATTRLPAEVAGVPVRHLPWDDIRADLRVARQRSRGSERLWLDQFATYLSGATAVRDPAEQWVYVVSVSGQKPGEGSHTFRDFVTKERVYFHPFGKNWPRRPPVLMGFRWSGRLQQVNRVERSEVVSSLSDLWPGLPGSDGWAVPHVVYSLGPNIPVPPLPSTGIVRARRLWALLDQLLTQPTIVEAERASKALTRVLD